MGTVYLVGAGPGDPGLLTLRGARLLRRADVVVHDALVDRRLLDFAPAAAKRIDVGKRAGAAFTTQETIHAILIEAAKSARTVVRLKGGDPFLFGRGGEEALALRDAGVRFRIVPGVTAGIAVPAYAGIPVTHRGIASSVTFVSGHAAAGSRSADWASLVRSGGTIVVFMPVAGLRATMCALLAAGLPATTPAAAIQWGTYTRQRVVTSGAAELTAAVERERLGTPATIVIGGVAALAERLAWFAPRADSAEQRFGHIDVRDSKEELHGADSTG